MIPAPILDELQGLKDAYNEAWKARAEHPDAFHADNLKYMNALRQHAPALIAAARQLEEVRRDAERYRYLRAQPSCSFYTEGWQIRRHWRDGTQAERGVPNNLDMIALSHGSLDQAIDAQLGEENG